MPNLYRTSDEIVADRVEDGRPTKLHLQEMNLFASGAFSNVYRGVAQTESLHKQEIVVKKTWPRKKGEPLEVRILGKLNRLKHKNIVRLLYSYQKDHDGRVCLGLIFEYVPLNLHQYLKQLSRRIDIIEVKLITWQLFRGQFHLQRMEISHRDIKPQNLLYDAESGLLKISDFGSSAIQTRKTAQPSYHVTRYYRPPELLLESRHYGSEIDIWSCGCVLAELLKGGVFLAGRNSSNQCEQIFELLGKPTADERKAMNINDAKYHEIAQSYDDHPSEFNNFEFMTNEKSKNSKDRKTAMFNDMIGKKDMIESVKILQQILVYHPMKRLAGQDLLLSQYFAVLFNEKTVRMDGKAIGCLTIQDWNNVKIGDTTITGESTDES